METVIVPREEYKYLKRLEQVAQERFKQRKIKRDFGIIDSIILIKQKEFNCKIVTGDKHFKGILPFKNLVKP